MIEVRGISHGYLAADGVSFFQALKDVSLQIESGTFVSFLGPSGCGKTTLLRIINGLITPTQGEIRIADERVEGPKPDRAMVFQEFNLLPWRTARGNVEFPLEVQGVAKAERHARAADVLKLVGLEDAAGQFPDELSGGMQQRVGLARAFAVDPKVMLYDEPFSALDPLIRRDMQDEVCRLQEETGKTMVFITHDLPEALRLGDQIAIMRDGRVVQQGTPEEVVGSPADEYVANFTRDIARSHVLTLRSIMRPAAEGEALDGARVPVTTTVRAIVPRLAQSERPVVATDGDRVVGVVDREAVLRAIAGEGD